MLQSCYFSTKRITRVCVFHRSSRGVVESVVVDEFKNLLDVVVDDVIGEGQQHGPLHLPEEDLGPELLEEVLILVEADGQEVKQVADVYIISEAEIKLVSSGLQLSSIDRKKRILQNVTQSLKGNLV